LYCNYGIMAKTRRKSRREKEYGWSNDICLRRWDVYPDRANPDELFDLVRPVLKKADIVFAQLEYTYSKKGVPQINRGTGTRGTPAVSQQSKRLASTLPHTPGTTTWTSANEGLLDAIENIKANGIAVFGAGKDIDEARKPVIMDIRSTRIGFLVDWLS